MDTYAGPKPCLHGSDAHCLEDVGDPDLERFTWLKGDAIFESLRQACIEPATRVFVGAMPAELLNPERSISEVLTHDLPRLLDAGVVVNPGLVAVIGCEADIDVLAGEMVGPLRDVEDDRPGPRRLLPHLGDRPVGHGSLGSAAARAGARPRAVAAVRADAVRADADGAGAVGARGSERRRGAAAGRLRGDACDGT